jgi:hypothetical protein
MATSAAMAKVATTEMKMITSDMFGDVEEYPDSSMSPRGKGVRFAKMTTEQGEAMLVRMRVRLAESGDAKAILIIPEKHETVTQEACGADPSIWAAPGERKSAYPGRLDPEILKEIVEAKTVTQATERITAEDKTK